MLNYLHVFYIKNIFYGFIDIVKFIFFVNLCFSQIQILNLTFIYIFEYI